MDKSKLNTTQAAVIETLPGPLFVAAGAGSGKTFTLKLRTANAFLENESGFALDSIDQVLAITYTDKAAAELLSRIKATLFEEELTDQAKDADNAWISTIHGFCSRLLRENALELGLDPEFRMVTEKEAADIRFEAMSLVAQRVRSRKLHVPKIGWNWHLFGRNSYERGLLDNAVSLLGKAQAVPDGLDALVKGLDTFDARNQIKQLKSTGEMLLEVTSTWEKVHASWEKPKIAALEHAVERANEWCDKGVRGDTGSRPDPTVTPAATVTPIKPQDYLDLLAAFPALSPSFGKGKDGADVIELYQQQLAQATYDANGTFGAQAVEGIRILAEALSDEMTRLKHERGLVDNDDLIGLTLDALRTNPHLANRYRNKFRLIMVDEFQDTNKTQIEIVRLIAQPNMENVCVVGDAQQSIYRFRGADVAAFTDYRNELAQQFPHVPTPTLQPKLTQNFRSHADILHLVDTIFAQPDSFGDAYLQLEPKGAINNTPDPVMDAHNRVTIDIEHFGRSAGGELKTKALRDSAARIANHFAQLKHAYEEQCTITEDTTAVTAFKHQTYALLLGTTTHAELYMDALREVGLESMMTSGSILLKTNEAKILEALLQLAVNKTDEKPLLTCLTSPLFAISDDTLLALSSFKPEYGNKPTLAGGFASRIDPNELGISPDDALALKNARKVLDNFATRARKGSITEAVRLVLVESGYLDRANRKGVRGLASVGNFSKLISMLESAEAASNGIASTVAAYEAMSASAQASPGILSAEEADFVQIMTIHGSKGLQFDHVVVADIRNGIPRSEDLLIENAGTAIYSLSKRKLPIDSYLEATMRDMTEARGITQLEDASTQGELRVLLEKISRQESLAEARRLLYVGLTRAVRSVYLSYVTKTDPRPKKSEPYESDGIMREVYTALEWDLEATKMVDTTGCDYGGSKPAKVIFEYLQDETVNEAEDKTEDEDKSESDGVDATEAAIDGEHANASSGEHTSVGSGTAETLSEGKNASNGAISYVPVVSFQIPLRDLPQMPLQSPATGIRSNVRSYSSLKHDENTMMPLAQTQPAQASPAGTSPAQMPSSSQEASSQVASSQETSSQVVSSQTMPASIGMQGLFSDESDEEISLENENDAVATDLGTAFHRLAQIAILERNSCGGDKLVQPSSTLVNAQTEKMHLTQIQKADLQKALNAWFTCPLAQEVCRYESLSAEVPFMVRLIDAEHEELFLEGEIDALAASDTEAFVIDYKTGGSPGESEEMLYMKHLQQAQCYAYALLRFGYQKVTLNFVRVEQLDAKGQPQVVRYLWRTDDIPSLEQEIIAHWPE